jgi:endonuclease-3
MGIDKQMLLHPSSPVYSSPVTRHPIYSAMATRKVTTKKAAKKKPLQPLPERAKIVYKRLLQAHPDAHCELDYQNAYQLLVATILSAQCTDKRVNMVTPALFRRYATPADLAAADADELEELIRSTGFFRNKRKSLIGMASALRDDHRGAVPQTLDELVRLPGVGRKTANVILGNAFGVNEGVVVDTHVGRLSQRLGLTLASDPNRIEQDLMSLFPKESWTMLAHLLIAHGRRICFARTPLCQECVLADICPSAGLV